MCFSIFPLTRRVLHALLLCILLALARLLFEISSFPVLCAARAAHFGEMLEYIVMSVALLTAGTYLLERVLRAEQK